MRSKRRYTEVIDRAFRLNAEGRLDESAACLRSILSQIPNEDMNSLGLIGSLLREANDFPSAIEVFRRAVTSFPTSERSSLGLFHSLWRLEDYDSALDELSRFISVVGGSDDHRLLLMEMNEGFFGSNPPEFSDLDLVERIRNVLNEDES